MAAEGKARGYIVRMYLASMGPRPDGRGRLLGMATLVITLALQWGRGRMAAEGALHRTADTMGGMLQWGRGRMAAEGRYAPLLRSVSAGFNGAAAGWPRKVSHGRARDTMHGASMGPRPDGRGR